MIQDEKLFFHVTKPTYLTLRGNSVRTEEKLRKIEEIYFSLNLTTEFILLIFPPPSHLRGFALRNGKGISREKLKCLQIGFIM